MKIVHNSICSAALISAVTALAHAQPAPAPRPAQPAAPAAPTSPPAAAPSASNLDAPNIAGSDDMPWNKGVPQATRSEARDVFLEGNRLFKIPLFSQAVEKYAEAIDKWKHPAFYFNLAIAEINLGQYLEARDHLEHAIQYGPEPLRADRFAEAQKQIVEVERHLARLRVHCPTREAEITLDGVTLFTGPGDRDVWVTPRAHEVTAKKPEYTTQAKRVTLAAGARETVDLSLLKLVEDRPWSVWKPWAVVIGGVAVAGASGLLQARSAHNFSEYDGRFAKLSCASIGNVPNTTFGCTQKQIDEGDPNLTPKLNRARLEQRIAVGGYIAGGALVAGGIALVYLNRPHVMEREDPNPGAGVAVIPVLSTDMVGVQVSVSR